jgi:hypothetical protein
MRAVFRGAARPLGITPLVSAAQFPATVRSWAFTCSTSTAAAFHDRLLSASPTDSDGETGLPQVYIGGIKPFLPTLIWLAVNEPSAAVIGKALFRRP